MQFRATILYVGAHMLLFVFDLLLHLKQTNKQTIIQTQKETNLFCNISFSVSPTLNHNFCFAFCCCFLPALFSLLLQCTTSSWNISTKQTNVFPPHFIFSVSPPCLVFLLLLSVQCLTSEHFKQTNVLPPHFIFSVSSPWLVFCCSFLPALFAFYYSAVSQDVFNISFCCIPNKQTNK